MRKWIIKNFVLGIFVTVFGKTFHSLRAPRILFPLFVLAGMSMSTNPDWILQWWDFVLLGMIAIGFWIGFPMFKWSYFILFPIKYEELDDMQKYDWVRAQKSGSLTGQQYVRQNHEDGSVSWDPILDYLSTDQVAFFEEYKLKMQENYYNKKFAGLANLIPVGLSIVAVIVWWNWIFPIFN